MCELLTKGEAVAPMLCITSYSSAIFFRSVPGLSLVNLDHIAQARVTITIEAGQLERFVGNFESGAVAGATSIQTTRSQQSKAVRCFSEDLRFRWPLSAFAVSII